ncbi:MAG: cysteine desulfurase [Candidatus Krumholzibacteria bacterium]|nr:cysteine desulfurase [Candidatus Krumholzibacteria bacterium]
MRNEAVAAMVPLLEDGFGNPQSVTTRGQRAAEVLAEAREQVAALVGMSAHNVIFAASGSEANNMALKGIARGRANKSKRVIISAVEHISIMTPAKTLEKEGFEIVTLPVDSYGLIDPEDLKKALEGGAAVVSMIHASTEVGTVQPVEELAAICREAGAPLHTDSWGAAGMIEADMKKIGASAMTIAAQNFGGPPGAAALILGKGFPMRPVIQGGVQERNLRAGQENIPAIAGMGVAAGLALAELADRAARLIPIRDAFIERLPAAIPDVIATGHPEKRLPGHASFCVKFIEGEGLLLFLDHNGIMAASGSACTSKSLKGSHVLEAMGYDAATAQGSIVFTFGDSNTIEDVDTVIKEMKPVVSRLREMSPIYNKDQG